MGPHPAQPLPFCPLPAGEGAGRAGEGVVSLAPAWIRPTTISLAPDAAAEVPVSRHRAVLDTPSAQASSLFFPCHSTLVTSRLTCSSGCAAVVVGGVLVRHCVRRSFSEGGSLAESPAACALSLPQVLSLPKGRRELAEGAKAERWRMSLLFFLAGTGTCLSRVAFAFGPWSGTRWRVPHIVPSPGHPKYSPVGQASLPAAVAVVFRRGLAKPVLTASQSVCRGCVLARVWA